MIGHSRPSNDEHDTERKDNKGSVIISESKTHYLQEQPISYFKESNVP